MATGVAACIAGGRLSPEASISLARATRTSMSCMTEPGMTTLTPARQARKRSSRRAGWRAPLASAASRRLHTSVTSAGTTACCSACSRPAERMRGGHQRVWAGHMGQQGLALRSQAHKCAHATSLFLHEAACLPQRCCIRSRDEHARTA